MGKAITPRLLVPPLLSACLGGLILLAAGEVLGHDPAAKLAAALGLGSGPVVGGILGGLCGGWLASGGPRRIAVTAGFLVGIGFLVAAWRLAGPYLWVVDIVMREAFGEGGQAYSGLALFLIAIPLFRTVAAAAGGLVAVLLERGRRQAPAED